MKRQCIQYCDFQVRRRCFISANQNIEAVRPETPSKIFSRAPQLVISATHSFPVRRAEIVFVPTLFSHNLISLSTPSTRASHAANASLFERSKAHSPPNCNMQNSRNPSQTKTPYLPPSAQIVKSAFYSYPSPLEATLSHPQQSPPSTPFPPPSPFNAIRALSAAPFITTFSPQACYLVSAEEFFEENPLIAATLKPPTQTKYAIALDNFIASSVAIEPTHLSLDQRLSIYIQERYTANARPGQRQEMSNLICMIALMYPSVKLNLGLARRCISGWKTLKPSRSSAPFTKELVLALAWTMLKKGKIEAATVLVTSFSACLRVSEALNLKWNRVALPGDLRLSAYPQGTAGVNIYDAKTSRYTGKLQFVKLSDRDGIKLLTELQRSRPSHSTRIAPISYQQYADELRESLRHFQFHETPFTSHSARIGKATEDFIRGEPVEQIAINGRWKSLNSLRYYLNNGRAWILNTPISQSQQQKLSHASAKMKHALQG